VIIKERAPLAAANRRQENPDYVQNHNAIVAFHVPQKESVLPKLHAGEIVDKRENCPARSFAPEIV